MIKLYWVGGYVRDQILGLKSKDIDFAVEAPSYEDMVAWIKTQGEIFLESPEFWTVRAHLQGKQPADYVLCRKDGQYSDGRRPDSVSPGTVYDDLARRDFTMNAIAIDDQTKQILDPFDGHGDIARKLIKCVGVSTLRFKEDALRLLRAIRFSITKGFFLSAEIEDCLDNDDLCTLLQTNVSDDRKRDELHRCFAYDTPRTLHLLKRFPKVAEAVFKPKIIWLKPTMEKP